jgi:hypothetical protein
MADSDDPLRRTEEPISYFEKPLSDQTVCKLCRCDGPLPIPIARLIFVNRYFFPDHSATIQILSDLTFHLAAAGHQVHVVASRQTAA